MHAVFEILLGLLVIGGCLLVCFSSNLMHSLVGLFVVLFTFSGIYLMLDAPFVAVIQLLVYVGGVCVLFLFGIMLTQKIGEGRGSNPSTSVKRSLLISLAVLALLGVSTSAIWTTIEGTTNEVTLRDIGNLLLSNYILPFEAVSVLLVAAMVGAVILIKKELDR